MVSVSIHPETSHLQLCSDGGGLHIAHLPLYTLLRDAVLSDDDVEEARGQALGLCLLIRCLRPPDKRFEGKRGRQEGSVVHLSWWRIGNSPECTQVIDSHDCHQKAATPYTCLNGSQHTMMSTSGGTKSVREPLFLPPLSPPCGAVARVGKHS